MQSPMHRRFADYNNCVTMHLGEDRLDLKVVSGGFNRRVDFWENPPKLKFDDGS